MACISDNGTAVRLGLAQRFGSYFRHVCHRTWILSSETRFTTHSHVHVQQIITYSTVSFAIAVSYKLKHTLRIQSTRIKP